MQDGKRNYKSFLKSFGERHGDVLGFPNVEEEYENSKSFVTAMCKSCGKTYRKRANDFISSFKGCRECNATRRKHKYSYSDIMECLSNANETAAPFEGLLSKDDYVEISCPIHGTRKKKVRTVLKDSGKDTLCQFCKASKSSVENGSFGQALTRESFERRMEEKYHGKYIYDINEFINGSTPMTFKCRDCGKVVHDTPDRRLNKAVSEGSLGCRTCDNASKRFKGCGTTEEFIGLANKTHHGRYSYDRAEYRGYKSEVEIYCPVHSYYFWQLASSHLHGCGCPKCRQSKVELEVMRALEGNGIAYEVQKRFEWLRMKQPMRLDFYLPECGTAIECQGEHHFFPVDYAGRGEEWSRKHHEEVVAYDKEKRRLCEEHGIRIMYFSHVKGIECVYEVITDVKELISMIGRFNA